MDVTIEGTLTPSVLLKRGERRRVQMTPRIQRLVDKGFVKVITAHDNGAQPAATSQPVDWDSMPDTPAPDEDDNGPGLYDGEEPDESEENGPDYPPPGNASREKWAAFLTEFGVPYPDGGEDDNGDPIPVATRDDLRVIWQQASGGSEPVGIKAELHAEFMAGAAEGIAQELRPFMEDKLTSLIRQSATQARSDVPVLTGNLGRSIKEEPIEWTAPLVAEGGISANTDYAAAVHEGSAPHLIKARNVQFLRFEVDGRTIFARSVNHPGSKARPFLLNAAERVIARETA